MSLIFRCSAAVVNNFLMSHELKLIVSLSSSLLAKSTEHELNLGRFSPSLSRLSDRLISEVGKEWPDRREQGR